ncbi:MAG: phage minor head protein, partial [Alphaproteobacteria bacterium]
ANPSAPTAGGIIADRPDPSGVTIENLAPGEGGILPDRPKPEGVVIQDLSPIHRLILEAMQRAEIVIENATSEHQRAFAMQMREKLGVADLVLKEPQLPVQQVRAMLDYLRQLQKLAETTPAQELTPDTEATIRKVLEQKKNQVILNFKQGLDESRQREAGVCQYIWGTVGDERVRDSHEANEGEVFSWNDPPDTGHPGEAENCRCSADPVVDSLHEDCEDAEEYLKNLTAEEIAAIVLALAAIISGAAGAGVIGVGIARGATVIGRSVITRRLGSEAAKRIDEAVAAQKPAEPPPAKPETPKPQTPKPSGERPKNVPKDWKAKPTKKGDGVVYEKPGSKGATYVKVQKGNPNSSNPGQRYDNVRVTRNGKSLDKNGNPVPKDSKESHIPLEDFRFKPELFE